MVRNHSRDLGSVRERLHRAALLIRLLPGHLPRRIAGQGTAEARVRLAALAAVRAGSRQGSAVDAGIARRARADPAHIAMRAVARPARPAGAAKAEGEGVEDLLVLQVLLRKGPVQVGVVAVAPRGGCLVLLGGPAGPKSR